MSLAQYSSRIVIVALLLCIATSQSACAQTNAEWDVWRIFVPAEDVGKLVPLDYNLIDVDELAAALKRESERRSEVPSVEAYLAESIYVVRANTDGLISEQSRWTVRSESDSARMKLKDLSVALRNSGITPVDDKPLLPNFRYSVDGTATLANIAGDTNYWFGFSASSNAAQGKQLVYDLVLPPATMSKWLVSAPENLNVSSPDAIVTAIDDPRLYLPEAWPSLASYEGQRWYLIHLSGKSQFRLVTETIERKDVLSYQQYVRRAALAYIASNKGLTLSADFEVERFSTVDPLRISFDSSLKIRSLTANDKAVEYRMVDAAESAKRTIELPSVSANGKTRVRVEAVAEAVYPFDAPLPQLEIARGFAWEGRTTVTAEEDLQVEEIALVDRPELSKPKLESTTIGRRWSADWIGAVPTLAAKFSRPDNQCTASSLTRLTVQQDWIAATTNMKLDCRGLQSNELRLRIGEGWFIDDVTLDASDTQVSIQLARWRSR